MSIGRDIYGDATLPLEPASAVITLRADLAAVDVRVDLHGSAITGRAQQRPERSVDRQMRANEPSDGNDHYDDQKRVRDAASLQHVSTV